MSNNILIKIFLIIYFIERYYAFEAGCYPSVFPKELAACIGQHVIELAADKAKIKTEDITGLVSAQCNFETKKIDCEKISAQKAQTCFKLKEEEVTFIYAMDENKLNYLCNENATNMTVLFQTPESVKCFTESEKCEKEYLGDSPKEERNWIKNLLATQVCKGIGIVWSCRFEKNSKCMDKRARSTIEDIRVIGINSIPDCMHVIQKDFKHLLSKSRFPYDPNSPIITDVATTTESSLTIKINSFNELLFWLIGMNMILF